MMKSQQWVDLNQVKLHAIKHIFSIAGISFALTAEHGLVLPDPPLNLQPFLSDGTVDVTMHVTLDKFPDPLEQMVPCFQTPRWFFYQLPGKLVAKVIPHRMDDSWVYVEFDLKSHCGILHIDHKFLQSQFHPFSSPMLEIVFATLLARQGGLLAHASGILHNQRTLLFMGSSGTGKTTTARLWERHTSAAVLCDDRIALRCVGNEYWAFGTPWHGDHPSVSPQGGRVDKIMFLQHAIENRAERMQPSRSSAMLYARSFPPLWDKAGLDAWVETSVNMAQQVSCFDFGFVPDISAVEYVKGMK
jgi:hypothetical protein